MPKGINTAKSEHVFHMSDHSIYRLLFTSFTIKRVTPNSPPAVPAFYAILAVYAVLAVSAALNILNKFIGKSVVSYILIIL